jgi:uncharacterized protein YllA (UPF0747 family)
MLELVRKRLMEEIKMTKNDRNFEFEKPLLVEFGEENELLVAQQMTFLDKKVTKRLQKESKTALKGYKKVTICNKKGCKNGSKKG